ncbi:MAG: chorismate lyase [Deltaproteobacteria bacterium]|nr:chorismate lyase [Deltaproteobacteria bacterium]
MEYNLAPLPNYRQWFKFEEAIDLFSRLSMAMPERLLLSSDGSLTRLLESVYLSPIEVEVKNQKTEQIDAAAADYLGVSSNQDAVIRDIWLTKGRQRLVYANSVFPTSGLDKGFLEKLIRGYEPLGHLLRSHNFLTLRDNWEIGIIQCPDAALDLSIPIDTPLWARRYRLLANPLTTGNGITAAIMEIFSPDVLHYKKL